MNGLLKKLQKIQDDCLDGKDSKKGKEDENVDEFTRLKKKIATEVKQIRQLIKDREDLENDAPGSVATVEVSHQIRTVMKDLRADANNLERLQKKEKEDYVKKNKSIPDKEAQIERREEMVGLVLDHIEECRILDQKRHGSSAFTPTAKLKDPTITELPDIDDPDFQLMRKNDKTIDGLLEDVELGVHHLKAQALEMGKEVERHGVMLDNLDAKVDKVNADLENINVRLAKALKSVRKGDRFIVDIILLCLLLGLGGYIYKLLK